MDDLIKSNEKTLAANGLALLYPVSVMGRHLRENGIHHHATVKFFDKPGITPEIAHEFASAQELSVPNPNNIYVIPKVFKNRFGDDVHVLSLHGTGIDHLKEVNAKAAHLGQPTNYQFQPHISVDKELHDYVANLPQPVKATDLSISFGNPELRHGFRTLSSYPLKKSLAIPGFLEKSSFGRKALATLGVVAGLAAPSVTSKVSAHPPKPTVASADKALALNAIMLVESGGGKNIRHKPLGGIHAGESAYGSYGLTPVLIRETISKTPHLKKRYNQALGTKGRDFASFMSKNPELEHKVASAHYDRLSRIFRGNLGHIAHAWLNGILGTMRFKHKGGDFNKHWHVKKVHNAYNELAQAKARVEPISTANFLP